MNQSELEANTCSRRQTRENACRQVAIGFGFNSDWSRKWRSQTVATQNQSHCVITFDTQLKTALLAKAKTNYFSINQTRFTAFLARVLISFFTTVNK